MNGNRLPLSDDELVEALRGEWERRDRPPRDLVERVLFAVALEGLEAEVAVLAEDLLEPLGARSAEPARTLTFTSEHASVMVTLTPRDGGRFRIDGWVAPASRGHVELRRSEHEEATERTTVDAQGRFALDDVHGGMVQLIFVPEAGGPLERPVAAPPVRL